MTATVDVNIITKVRIILKEADETVSRCVQKYAEEVLYPWCARHEASFQPDLNTFTIVDKDGKSYWSGSGERHPKMPIKMYEALGHRHKDIAGTLGSLIDEYDSRFAIHIFWDLPNEAYATFTFKSPDEKAGFIKGLELGMPNDTWEYFDTIQQADDEALRRKVTDADDKPVKPKRTRKKV